MPSRFDFNQLTVEDLRRGIIEAMTGNAAYWDEDAEEVLDLYFTKRREELEDIGA